MHNRKPKLTTAAILVLGVSTFLQAAQAAALLEECAGCRPGARPMKIGCPATIDRTWDITGYPVLPGFDISVAVT
jgi:hypothetical protein